MAVLSPLPKMQFFDANGDPLVGGKLYTYAAGTTTPLATYTSSSGAVSNTNPVILDSRGEANVWLALTSYKFKLTTATDVEIWTVDNVTSGETFGTSQWLTSVAGTNTITATLSSANFVAYDAGQTFSFKAANANTGAVTLNINSLGAKPVTKTGAVALAANDILAGQTVTVVYDGTRFQLTNFVDWQAPGVIGFTTPNDAYFGTIDVSSGITTGTLTASGPVVFSNGIDATAIGTGSDFYSVGVSQNFVANNVIVTGTFGYSSASTGAGGTVTQATSRTTGVTINKFCGQITLYSTTAVAGATTAFTVTNSKILGSSRQAILLSFASQGASTGVYSAIVSNVATGSFQITLYCISAPAAAEAPIINFVLIDTITT